MQHSIQNKENGFTLVELLIAIAIGLLVLGVLVSTFIIQRKTYDVQEQLAEMVQNARAAMDIITREALMAGFNPSGAAFNGIPYSAGQL
ncbi:MAG: prepilin-type N-terminal cleavage/methylation domain-containing protein, partial [Deltaproteobacteria bacterium]|nr:prepilin-type N-terminal cleavage/methylation domain-containing protein [Deltaproteobacteria bacterium]